MNFFRKKISRKNFSRKNISRNKMSEIVIFTSKILVISTIENNFILSTLNWEKYWCDKFFNFSKPILFEYWNSLNRISAKKIRKNIVISLFTKTAVNVFLLFFLLVIFEEGKNLNQRLTPRRTIDRSKY